MENTTESQAASALSAQKLAANQANAQKSTGPQTAEGKAISSQNAIKHGAYAKGLMPYEDPAAFDRFYRKLKAELKPETEFQAVYFEDYVWNSWRLQRIRAHEAWLYDTIEDAGELTKKLMSLSLVEMRLRRAQDDALAQFLALKGADIADFRSPEKASRAPAAPARVSSVMRPPGDLGHFPLASMGERLTHARPEVLTSQTIRAGGSLVGSFREHPADLLFGPPVSTGSGR